MVNASFVDGVDVGFAGFGGRENDTGPMGVLTVSIPAVVPDQINAAEAETHPGVRLVLSLA